MNRPAFEDVFKRPLQSIEMVETSTELIGRFGLGPLKVIPSLKSFIVHDGQSIFSVEVKNLMEYGFISDDDWIIHFPDIEKNASLPNNG